MAARKTTTKKETKTTATIVDNATAKVAEVADEAKKTAAAAKDTVGKKAAAAKDTVEKKASAAKKTVKKVVKKEEPVVTTTVEFYGRSVLVSDIIAKASEAHKASRENAVIETLNIYIKPEENAAYYVVNGEASADFKVEL